MLLISIKFSEAGLRLAATDFGLRICYYPYNKTVKITIPLIFCIFEG